MLLQGNVNIFNVKDNILSLSHKLQFYISFTGQNNFDSFTTLNDFLQKTDINLMKIYTVTLDYIFILYENIIKYFPEVNYNNS